MLKAELNLPKYHEDAKVLHTGCEENRSYYIPYAPGEAKNSSRVQLLNGDWDYRFYNNPFEVEDFTVPDYSYGQYDTIPVPGCIQMYGYDRHQYTNVRFPFPYDPPYVPAENPTSVYHTSFSATQDLNAYKYYLNFEGVDSCFYVYINQTLIGYSQVSHSTSEFDITPYIQSGDNELTVVVLKWCDGSYLEDQDKFRMTGIFRDVYLLVRPVEHIKDYNVKTIVNAPYTLAEVTIDFTFAGSFIPITCILQDEKGTVIAKKEVENGNLSIEIENPNLWNAETPYLYNLTITTPDEVIYQKVGIRCIEIKEDIIYINGERVKIKGVNRHDSDPVTGFTISKEHALKDLKLMKEHNINAIRTSHYPNAPWFTGLCNEYGFYVIGESDIEAHGATSFYGGSAKTTYGDLAQRDIFAEAILDRNQRNVIRDKNNPSIIMWSMGNEAGYSKAFEDTGRWIKAYDPTRLLHYESSVHETGGHTNDTSMLDVYSTMYASVDSIEEYLQKNPKPYVLCEFVHAMGNGPGDIEDYFECIYKHDRFVGGFVWEWCDHAIYRGITTDGRKIFHYGGDSGEFPHDGNFCVDGMVSPDRIPHPALAEYKNVIRPVRASLISSEEGIVELENKLDFTNLSDYITLRGELLYDGQVVQTLELGTIDLKPHEKETLMIPYDKSYLTDSAKKASLTFRLIYLQSKDMPFTKKGHELGFDQLFLKESTISFPMAEDNTKATLTENVSVEETSTKVIVSGGNFRYQFNKLRGTFDTLVMNNQSIIDKPIEYNIWRAPIDNDREIRSIWESAGYDRALTRVYETQVTKENQVTAIHCKLAITAIQIQHILDIEVTWYIGTDGTITIKLDGKRNTDLPYLPRFGLRFFLPKEYQQVNYLGYGPYESYVDKRRSSWYGRFQEIVDTTYVDYIRPQENSSHYGCSEVTLSSENGQCLHITGENPFSFQATPYTQEELAEKAHNYELQKADSTILCLDYKMSGIGSNSCGPELAKKYQLCEDDIRLNLTIQFQKEDE